MSNTETTRNGQFTVSQFVDTVKNINFVNMAKSVYDYSDTGKQIYLQNKKNVDLALCILCFFFILLGWLNISIISSLYFLGLMYMTVITVGVFYNKLPTAADKELSLQQRVDIMDNIQVKTVLFEFASLTSNWLMYASLVICDWSIQTVNTLIGGGLILGSGLQIGRFLVYMHYCRYFIKSLKPYCDNANAEKTFISEGLAKSLSLSNNVKHLINVISINNVFCYNLFAKANMKVLMLIDGCSSAGVDMLSTICLEALKQSSKTKSLTSVTVNSTWLYLKSLSQKMSASNNSESKSKKNS